MSSKIFPKFVGDQTLQISTGIVICRYLPYDHIGIKANIHLGYVMEVMNKQMFTNRQMFTTKC